MEPKSIAFYTAVALSMLAVLSATIFPTLVQSVQAATTTTPSNDRGGAADGYSQSTPSNDRGTSDSQSTPSDKQSHKDSGSNGNQDGKSDKSNNNHDAKDPNGSSGQGLTPSAGVPSCGDVLTQDVTLQSDLNCSGNGLTVGESGITINLNGHTITSNHDQNSADETTNYDGNSGILVPNANHVTILGGGQIAGFDKGIWIEGSSGAKVTDVDMRGNGVGVLVSGSEDTELSANSILNNKYGIILESSHGGVIAFNQIAGNREAGIILSSSSEFVIVGNNMFGNGKNGLFLDALSSGNRVDYNNVFGDDTADINNANGLSPSVNNNSFGQNNNCAVSDPDGLC